MKNDKLIEQAAKYCRYINIGGQYEYAPRNDFRLPSSKVHEFMADFAEHYHKEQLKKLVLSDEEIDGITSNYPIGNDVNKWQYKLELKEDLKNLLKAHRDLIKAKL